MLEQARTSYIIIVMPARINAWRCIHMDEKRKNSRISDEQAKRKDLSRQFDHEFANEPLSANERYNNKKTKKRQ